MERDLRELSVGLESAIATADRMIINKGTKAELDRRVREILEEAIEKWAR